MPSTRAAPSRTTSEPIAKPPHAAHRSSSDPGSSTDGPGETDSDAAAGAGGRESESGIVLHKSNEYKFGAVYWRHGFPENGRMTLSGQTLSFKGIVGKRLSFNLEDVDIASVSRMGGLVHDAFTVTSKSGADGGKFLFSTVLKDRKKVLDKIQSALAEEDDLDSPSGRIGPKKKKFRMPPDPTLQKMNIIAERKLKGVSLQDYYEVAWSEGYDCEKPAMYGPFLQQQKKNDVVVGLWKSGEFQGEWCGERYSGERIVTFNFMKQTIGQTLVEVKHSQQCRRVSNDQCVVQIKMAMKGFPYADCFVVHVRHVVSRVGDNDLSIQIGMTVEFLKGCLFENKIKTNTGAETTKAQLTLLEMILEGCGPYAKEAVDSEEDSEVEEDNLDGLTVSTPASARGFVKLPDPVYKVLRSMLMMLVTIFRACIRPYLPPELFEFAPSTVEEALLSARTSVKSLEELSMQAASERQRKDISREIRAIEKSMTTIEQISTLEKKN